MKTLSHGTFTQSLEDRVRAALPAQPDEIPDRLMLGPMGARLRAVRVCLGSISERAAQSASCMPGVWLRTPRPS